MGPEVTVRLSIFMVITLDNKVRMFIYNDFRYKLSASALNFRFTAGQL